MKRSPIILSVAFLFAATTVPFTAAQQTKSDYDVIVNGKAISLPKPVYPEAARAAGISGVIGVNVVIDEAGNVVSAIAEPNDLRERRDVDGTKLAPLPADPLLRASAEEAARNARFSPTMANGPAVSTKGRLVYSFVADQRPLDTSSLDPKLGNSGVLNGKATHLPKPEYPAAAMAVRAAGAVTVQMVVDEDGNPTSAKAISGHPLLRMAAETAALQARFSPTFLSGQAVKVAGVVTYNFVLPKVEDK